MISLISSTDVAILADKILEQILVSHLESENNIFCETICNQAYNFSCSGLITLSELHNLIFKEIFNDTNTNFNDVWNENEHSSNTYPSVHCGAISNLKAVENLAKINFEFSTVSESIQEATKFFKSLTNIKLNAEPTKLIISSEFQENLRDAYDKLNKNQRNVVEICDPLQT